MDAGASTKEEPDHPATSLDSILSPMRIRLLCAAVLCIGLLIAAISSRHWPLLGDASLMHYVVFLMHQGLTPYRDIVDVNLPGTYLFEAAAMRLFGLGGAGWRVYDLTLLATVLTACCAIAGRKRWFAGVFAGCLFGLVHLQDGLAQAGQRDLLMAVLLLWACAALFTAMRGARPWPMLALFGLALGCTVLIKPVLLPLALCLVVLAIQALRAKGISSATSACISLLSLIIPIGLVAVWLIAHHAAHAFMTEALPLMRLHAQLGRQPLGYLFAHSIAPLGLLVLLWLILQLPARLPLTSERTALLLGVAGTALAYIAQGKGYPYQRYPLLALLLLFIALDVDQCLQGKGSARGLALLTCAAGCLFLAPKFAALATTFVPATPFQDALAERLTASMPAKDLAGQVQCLDTFGGCIDTLYRLRLRQSTGFLYDCYLFTPQTATRDRYRAAFWAAYKAAAPRIVILTDQFCFGDPRGFDKLNQWPVLAADLAQNYRRQPPWRSPIKQHWWSRREESTHFILYLRKPAASADGLSNAAVSAGNP